MKRHARLLLILAGCALLAGAAPLAWNGDEECRERRGLAISYAEPYLPPLQFSVCLTAPVGRLLVLIAGEPPAR